MSKLIIGLYVVTASLALILIKLGSSDGAPLSFEKQRIIFNLNPLIFMAGFLYIFSFMLYTYLISKYDLGYIIPLGTALVYILIFVSSFVIFNETFTVLKIAGISLIILGLILLNIKN